MSTKNNIVAATPLRGMFWSPELNRVKFQWRVDDELTRRRFLADLIASAREELDVFDFTEPLKVSAPGDDLIALMQGDGE